MNRMILWPGLAGLLLLMVGCGLFDREEPYRSPAAIAFEEQGLSLKDTVEALLAESQRRSTVDERIVLTAEGPVRIPRRTAGREGSQPSPEGPPASAWRPESPSIRPLGERLYEATHPPHAVAIVDDGSVFLAADRLLRLRPESEPEAVTAAEARELKLDATGTRLAAAGGGRAVLLEGDDFGSVRELGEVPTGSMAWSLEGGTLLFLRDHILFDAEEEDDERIFLQTARLDLRTGELAEGGFAEFRRYAAVGTLPAAGIMWAHLRQSHQIDPVPAPLLQVQEGAPLGFLTETMDAADIQPTASRAGDLAWLRTRRMGAATARGFLGRIEGGEPPVLLSNAPTHHVAVSPSGEWGVLVLEEAPGTHEVRRFALEEARERAGDMAVLAEADRLFGQRLGVFRARLREVYDRLPEVTRARSDDGPVFAGAISADSVRRLREALIAGLEQQLRLSLTVSAGSLADLDALLDHARPHLPEEDPALIAALGVFIGAVLEEEAGATWLLERWAGGLSGGMAGDFGTDGLTYAIACPFVSARAALHGELALASVPARIGEKAKGLPLYLADNLGEAAVDAVELAEFARAGFPAEAIRLGELRESLWRNDGLTPAAARFAANMGGEYGAEEMRVLGAVRLAQLDPTRPEALRFLARALGDSYETTLAAEVHRLLVEFEPEEPELRIEYGDVLATLDLLTQASDQYRLADHFDESGTYVEELHGRLQMIRRLRDGR